VITCLKRILRIGRMLLCCDQGMVGEETPKALWEVGSPTPGAIRLRRGKAVKKQPLSRLGRYRMVLDSLG
jgi:hypothetical protein